MYEYSNAMRQIVNDRGEQLRRSATRSRRARRPARRRLHALVAVLARH
jgi:hypothetical protein